MPIKSLAERYSIPVMGKIRLGIKDSARNNAPRETEHFVLDPTSPNQDHNVRLREELLQVFGENPKALRVMFPNTAVNLFWQYNYMRYKQDGKRACVGDGEEASCALDSTQGLSLLGNPDPGGRRVKVRCDGTSCVYFTKKPAQCAPVGILKVILPDVNGILPWQLTTRSWSNIVTIKNTIEWLEAVCGRYAMIPLSMARIPQKMEDPKTGKMRTHYLLRFNMEDLSIAKLQDMVRTPAPTHGLATPDPLELPDDMPLDLPPDMDDDPFADPQSSSRPMLKTQSDRVYEISPSVGATPAPASRDQIRALSAYAEGSGWSLDDIAFKLHELLGVRCRRFEELSSSEASRMLMVLRINL